MKKPERYHYPIKEGWSHKAALDRWDMLARASRIEGLEKISMATEKQKVTKKMCETLAKDLEHHEDLRVYYAGLQENTDV